MESPILQPKNWANFQHYKDRAPPWIKLHRALLDDYDFACLPIASKALAPLLWLLAAEQQDGSFTGDAGRLAHRLRWDVSELGPALLPLIDKGFFVIASGSLADCYQSAIPEREAEAERETDQRKATVQPSAAPCRFSEFWAVYPNKKGRKDAERHWKAQKADAIADQIIEHVRTMLERDDGWRRGYVPMGSTYVNGRRWEDEPKAAPVQDRDQRGVTAPPPKNIGAAAAFVPSESKLERQSRWLHDQHARGSITDDDLAVGLSDARQKYGNGGARA